MNILRLLGTCSLIFLSSFVVRATNSTLIAEQPVEQTDTIITETRDLKDTFQSISSSVNAKMIITVGGPYSLVLKGHHDDLQSINTEIMNNTLTISKPATFGKTEGYFAYMPSVTVDGTTYSCQGSLTVDNTGARCCSDGECVSLSQGPGNRPQVEIYLTLPSLQHLSLGGPGTTSINELKGEECVIEVNGSQDVMAFDVEVNLLDIAIRGSATATVSGRADSLALEVSGSGSIDTTKLEAKDVRVTVSGSGNADVYAQDLLVANISGSGDVRYAGKPRIRKTVSGAGSIEQL